MNDSNKKDNGLLNDDVPSDLKPKDVPAYALPYVKKGPLSVKEFGEWVKALREEKGLTLTQLGDMIGYSNPYLSQIETGKKKKMPSPELLEKLAKPLGVNYSDLLFMAGYDDLAKGVRLREAQAEFQGDIDNLFNDEGSVEIIFKENRYENVRDANGATIQYVIPNEELVRRFFDIRYLLTKREKAYYNGHLLTDQDRKRILDVLKALFPEYQEPKK